MRFVVVSVLAVLVASGCLNRPNPRITSLTSKTGPSKTETSFDYDDKGQLDSVERDDGEGFTTTRNFTWDGSRLTKMKTESADTDFTDITTTRFDYDDSGKITKITIERDNSDDQEISVDYDDQNRIAKTSSDFSIGDASQTSETTFKYASDGALKSIDSENAFDDGTTKTTNNSSIDFEAKDGHIVSFEISSDNSDGSTTVDVEYDGGRLSKLSAETVQNGDKSTGDVDYDYDDQGRIEGATASVDSGDDTDVTVEYDDGGDVPDIDLTPTGVTLLPGLWDMRGNGYTSIDPRTDLVRLSGGASW